MSELDHRQIIASLSVDDRRELTDKQDAPGLWRLAIHGGSIVLLAALILLEVPLWPLLMLPLGILIVFLFTLLHETIHETAFRTERLNRLVAVTSGFLILLPPAWFRYFHFAHHRYTHDPDNDPELMSPKPETIAQYLRYLSGWPYWSGMAKVVAVNALGGNKDSFVPEKGRAKVITEARWFLVIYALLVAGSALLQSPALLWIWIVPALLGQPFLRAYLLAEHTRCPHVANMLENTRTTFTTGIVRFVAWNCPITPSITPIPRCPSIGCHDSTRSSQSTCARRNAVMCASIASW